MYLNLYVISRWLKGITGTFLSSDPLHADLTGVSRIYSDAHLQKGIVYVGHASELPDPQTIGPGLAFVVIGLPDTMWLNRSRHDVLVCNEHLSAAFLADQIQQILQRFFSWEQSLLSALTAGKSLSDLCMLSLSIFENPIQITGVNYDLIGIAENETWRYNFDYREAGSDFIRQDMIDMLLTDASFPDTFEKKTPQLYSDRWDMYDLYLNIFIRDTYAARIVIDATCTPLSVCDYVPVLILGKYVQMHLEMNPYSTFRYLDSFKEQLLHFIQKSNDTDTAILRLTLKRINWDEHAEFICAYIRTDAYTSVSGGVHYQSRLLENTFPNCIAVPEEDCITAVFNCSLSSLTVDSLYQKLVIFLRDHLMRAGISVRFSDFMKLPVFFLQAKAALEYGEKKDNTAWIHAFTNLRLEYILHHGIYALPAEALIPQELLALTEYDNAHHTQLTDTLRLYLEENCNIQNTIEKLFIHRSTFSYRLSRIYSFIPESMLDTPGKRLYFLNVFHLLD